MGLENMNTKIAVLLKNLEDKHGVEVLYACETGSRAWGFPSPDSDYDVRMIYRHPVDWYLSLSDKKDTIEYMSEDGELDVTGWDIKKCLQLMWRSNGALLERVQSPIIYSEKAGIAALLNGYAQRCYSPIATMHHYLGMCKKCFTDVAGKDEVKLKGLFYALRAALCCKWIQHETTPPPIVFETMVQQLIFEPALKQRIRELVVLKAGKSEKYLHPAEHALNDFIATEIQTAEAACAQLGARRDKDVDLDGLFQQIIKVN
jgi:uncharacterized protein